MRFFSREKWNCCKAKSNENRRLFFLTRNVIKECSIPCSCLVFEIRIMNGNTYDAHFARYRCVCVCVNGLCCRRNNMKMFEMLHSEYATRIKIHIRKIQTLRMFCMTMKTNRKFVPDKRIFCIPLSFSHLGFAQFHAWIFQISPFSHLLSNVCCPT